MNGEKLVDLFKLLMDGEDIGDDNILSLINQAKDVVEAERPWMKLRTFDDSISFYSSEGIDSPKDLPTGFLRTFGKYPLVLYSGSDYLEFVEIPMEERRKYSSSPYYFYIDHRNNKLYISGGLSGSYSSDFFYLKKSDDIAVNTSWIFPTFAHVLLAIEAVKIYRGEIDYDSVNEKMIAYGMQRMDKIESSLVMWDANLQISSRRGRTKSL